MSYGGKMMDYLECDDMMEGTSEYCAFDHKYCAYIEREDDDE